MYLDERYWILREALEAIDLPISLWGLHTYLCMGGSQDVSEGMWRLHWQDPRAPAEVIRLVEEWLKIIPEHHSRTYLCLVPALRKLRAIVETIDSRLKSNEASVEAQQVTPSKLKNETQYEVTKREAAKFSAAMTHLRSERALIDLEYDALNSQYQDLMFQIRMFDQQRPRSPNV